MDGERETTFQNLLNLVENFIKSETVVGKPLYIGQGFIIPLFKVSIGMGEGKGGNKNTGASEGTGIGASIVPHAIISVTEEETTVISLAQKSTLQSVTETLPEILKKAAQEEQSNN